MYMNPVYTIYEDGLYISIWKGVWVFFTLHDQNDTIGNKSMYAFPLIAKVHRQYTRSSYKIALLWYQLTSVRPLQMNSVFSIHQLCLYTVRSNYSVFFHSVKAINLLCK